jgi:hypothetical protein
MLVDDETVMAYVDGELEPAARAHIEQALAVDPALAARVHSQRALRARLVAALAGGLAEPVPGRLLQVARTAPAGVAPPRSLPQRVARGTIAQLTRARLAVPWSLAAAASVALVVVLLRPLSGERAAAPLLRDGQLLARGTLAGALDATLAANQEGAGPVRIGLSFRDHSGRYCRTFSAQPLQTAGLACRRGADWVIERTVPAAAAAAAAAASDGAMRMAGSGWPAQLLTEVDQRIAGDPLDAAGERQARARGWQP